MNTLPPLTPPLPWTHHRPSPPSAHKALAWRWGVKGPNTIRNIFYKVRYGQTIFKAARVVSDRIMDSLENHLSLVGVLVAAKVHCPSGATSPPHPPPTHPLPIKSLMCATTVRPQGRVSKRRLCGMYKDATGADVSVSTLHRALQRLNVRVLRRKYIPLLRPFHKMDRYFFGTQHLENRQ